MKKLEDNDLDKINGGMGQGTDLEGGARTEKHHCPVCCKNNPEDLVDFEVIGSNPPRCIQCGYTIPLVARLKVEKA